MYTLENTMLKKTIVGLSLSATMLLISGCASETKTEAKAEVAAPAATTVATVAKKKAVDGGSYYETKDGKYTEYRVNTQDISQIKGRTPTANEIRAWNVDMHPDGDGIPEFDTEHGSHKPILKDGKKVIAEGNVEWGNELYDAQCSMCHGDFGAGGKGGYPTLSGGDISSLTNQLLNPADAEPNVSPPVKNIGSYWPYASTLFWYIKDSMPYPHPKSLTNSETYAITAYLLYENGVKIGGKEFEEETKLNKANFLSIEMPNKDGFYPNVDTPENPQQGVDNVTNFLANPENYGTGIRCMTDCFKEDVKDLTLRIGAELFGSEPTVSTVRDLPVLENNFKSTGQELYETTCSACHSSDAMGAPVVGDKAAWIDLLEEKGTKGLYDNGINGINGMPPKGGNMDLTDEQMKEIIDYMIKASQ